MCFVVPEKMSNTNKNTISPFSCKNEKHLYLSMEWKDDAWQKNARNATEQILVLDMSGSMSAKYDVTVDSPWETIVKTASKIESLKSPNHRVQYVVYNNDVKLVRKKENPSFPFPTTVFCR